ncbi:MAG TPA: glycosyltransferase family 39 protein [Blastocatellia bacterium]|nr:glycosyltransferase family 39 protein [Blastocatellia bacterium]
MNKLLIVILVLAAAPYFTRLGASSLWDSNEAFYAETPREMIESGDYINPSFNYQPRFNKPPLCYWIVALFYKIFGTSEAIERLTIALAAMIMIATAFALGREIFSVQAGLLAAIGLAIAPRFLMFSRRIMIDVYLAMFMSVALLFFVLAENRPQKRRLYLALMYASVGLGIITKGPVAAVLPALSFVIYLAINHRLRAWREMMMPAGLLIIAAIVLPWYVAVYTEHGWNYIETFILKDNLSRFTQPVWGPRRSLFFYIPVLLGDMFPWSLFLLPFIWQAARGKINKDKRWALLLIWVAVIVIFYSLSRNKEDLYILPIYPAVAALVGGLLARFIASNQLAAVQWTAVTIGAAIALAGTGVFYLFGHSSEPYGFDGAIAIGSIAIIGGLVTVVAATIKQRFAAVIASALALVVLNWIFVLWTLPGFERFKPVRPFSQIIASRAAVDSLVGYYKIASPSMVFYLRRQVFEYYKQEELQQALVSGKEVYCLIAAEDYETIRQSLPVPTYILASYPLFQVKLKSILNKIEPPRLMLISNKGGAEIAQ